MQTFTVQQVVIDSEQLENVDVVAVIIAQSDQQHMEHMLVAMTTVAVATREQEEQEVV